MIHFYKNPLRVVSGALAVMLTVSLLAIGGMNGVRASTASETSDDAMTTEYIAHRGDTYRAPENTLASLKKAFQAGYDGIEFDIWFTKAGEILVSHDASLKRVYGVDVDVRDVPKGGRKKYIAINNTGYSYSDKNLYLPSFKSFAQYINKAGMKAYIHVKCPTATTAQMAHLKKAVDKYGIGDDCVVFSGYQAVTRLISKYFDCSGEVFALASQTKYGFKGCADLAVKNGAKTLIFSYNGRKKGWLSRGDVAYARKKGLSVLAYQNKNEYSMAIQQGLGLDGQILAVEDLDEFEEQAPEMKRTPLRIAHRGDVFAAPENTLAAFKAAGSEGYDGVELDIWFTNDGEVLVSHEATLLAVYGNEIDVMDVAKGTRKSYIAKVPERKPSDVVSGSSIDATAVSGTAIRTDTGSSDQTETVTEIPKSDLYLPSLASALKVVNSYGMRVFIHVKNPVVTDVELDRLYRIMNKYGESDAIVFSGYDSVRTKLSGLFKYTGGVFTGNSYESYIARAVKYGLDYVIFRYDGDDYDISDEEIDEAHADGLDVFVYAKNTSTSIPEDFLSKIDGKIFNAVSPEG